MTTPQQHANPQQRSMLIDVVRGMAILLVVMGHINEGLNLRGWFGSHTPFSTHLDAYIYTFHMPAFFFVSGIFLTRSITKRGPWSYFKGRLGVILYPYYLWAIFQGVCLRFFSSHTSTPYPGDWPYIKSILTTDSAWFLPTLFLTLMAAMLLLRVPASLRFLLSVIIAMFTLYSYITHVTLFYNVLRHLPYLTLGMWVGLSFVQIERIPKPLAAIAAVLLCVASWWITLTYVHPITYPRVELLLGILGTAMLLLLARLCRHSVVARGFAWIGEASLGIFLISPYLQGASRELLFRGLHITTPWIQLFLPSAICCVIPAWLYQHRVRFHIDWLFQWPYPPKDPKRPSPASPELAS